MNPCAVVFVPHKLNPCAVEFRPQAQEMEVIIPNRIDWKRFNTPNLIDWKRFNTPARAMTVIYNAIVNGPEYSHLNRTTIIPFENGSNRIRSSIRDCDAVRSKKMIGRVYWVRNFTVGLSKHHTKCGEYEIVYKSVMRYRVKQLGNYIYKNKIITIKNEFENIREVLEDIRRHVVTPTSYMKERKAIYVKNVIRVQSIYRGELVRRKNKRRVHNRSMFRRAVCAIGIIKWWYTVKKTRPSIPECPICLADACPEGERDVIKTPCGHVFCTECLQSHVMNTIGNRGCPMCRAELTWETILGEEVNPREEYLGISQTVQGHSIVTVHTVSWTPRPNHRQVVIRFRNCSDYRLCIHYIWNGRSSDECYGISPEMVSRGIITYEDTIFVITYLNSNQNTTRRWRICTSDGYDQILYIY